jgi:hypothetical protein
MDDAFYGSLCDQLGIHEPNIDLIANEACIKAMVPFKEHVLVAAAQIHFFHGMDSDVERLEFLIEQAQQGNDPDALLALIGGDRAYWDKFLTVYRSDGKSAAMMALETHLMGG